MDRRSRIRDILLARGVTSPLLDQMQETRIAPQPLDTFVYAPPPPQAVGWIDALLTLIADAEAGPDGYDAIHHRALVRPAAPPTLLTLGEIFDWIRATPRQNHAIGRYQIIPSTLRYLVEVEGLRLDEPFSAELQDRLAIRLIRDAGLDAYLVGQATTGDFMDALAFVWAGLPLGSGRSAYEGIAGNRATMSRREYEDRFVSIFDPVTSQVVMAAALR